MTAPGPAPDRAAAEDPEAWSAADEVRCSIENGEWISHQEAQAVLAELDRQRALIAAVLALCDEAEARAPHIVGGRLPAILSVAEIRALLEGDKR